MRYCRRRTMTYTPPPRRRIKKSERRMVYQKCDGHCAYCGIEINISQMQVDHMIPMDLYDVYKAINIDIDTMDYYMPTCRSCNNYKSSYTLDKFRTAIERWTQVLTRDSVTYRNAVRFGQVQPTPQPVTFYFERSMTSVEQEMVQGG